MKLPSLPFARPDVLDLAPQTHHLIRNEPITRVRTSVGDEVWLVTGYEHVKALFTDDRLGRSHHDPPNAARVCDHVMFGGPSGEIESEKRLIDQMRHLLAPAFTAHRMRAVETQVQAIVDGLLDEMDQHGPPVDLHRALAYPLTVRVICELLGVPFSDREKFEIWARDLDVSSGEAAAVAFGGFLDYLRGLVESKRSEPAQDVISDLVAAAGAWGLGTDDIAAYALVLLYVGHPSTATNINSGVALLLTNPEQRAALAGNPSLIGSTVEEILRLVPLGNRYGLLRYAHADIPIGGVTIARGDGVLLVNAAANRDPAAFADPGRMDITRRPNAHLAFGLGIRRCLGASLARLELTAVFRSLFQRFPDLALAEPVERLETYTVHVVERLARLPVTW